MDRKTFQTIWDESGLPEYFSVIDKLVELGYTFTGGEMEYYENAALNDFIGDRTVTEVPISEYADILPKVKDKANLLREHDIRETQKIADAFKAAEATAKARGGSAVSTML